jgi:hypothetical protein
MTEASVTARIWHVGRDLHARVRAFFDGPPGPASTPLELLQAALDELERKAQPAGRGARLFPYNRIVVHVSQPNADRPAVEAVFRQLEPRLRDRLREIKCEGPASIATRVSFSRRPAADGAPVVSVECLTETEAVTVAPPTTPACPRVTIAILKGRCERTEYSFAEPVILIGRTAELVDAHGRVRRNHVAFLGEPDGATETVGRAHARLQFEAGAYRLFNESRSNPTCVLRDGRSHQVLARDPQGLRVQSGDEIHLGRAVIRVTISPP